MSGAYSRLRRLGKTFRFKLIAAFCISMIIPLALLTGFTVVNIYRIAEENSSQTAQLGLVQTRNSLEVGLQSYHDILYQLYTDDEVVQLVKDLDQDINPYVARHQLHRRLGGLVFSKDYIQGITILTRHGQTICYDLLSARSNESSWMPTADLSQQAFYDFITQDNATHLIPTKQVNHFAGKPNYSFHLAHRIINYKDVLQNIGVIVLSIDEEMLRSLCVQGESAQNDTLSTFYFLLSPDRKFISFPDRLLLNHQLAEQELGSGAFERELSQCIYTSGLASPGDHIDYQYADSAIMNFTLVEATNSSILNSSIRHHIVLALCMCSVSLLLCFLIIFLLSNTLARSIKDILFAIRQTEASNLNHIQIEKHMPIEIQSIACQYNKMIDRLAASMQNEKEALLNKKNAEITALEAQINPHFIYNTLDSINWIAIDAGQMEISHALVNLARILRYSISNSHGIVPISEEIRWLEDYISLQKTRLNCPLICTVSCPPELMECKLHKLILQPFIENAFVHGFIGIHYTPKIEVFFQREGPNLVISIADNGVGFSVDQTEQTVPSSGAACGQKGCHIGMENAISRIHMYYGEDALVSIVSTPGEGCQIVITIPQFEAGVDGNENCRN